jgi:hypothetical protein
VTEKGRRPPKEKPPGTTATDQQEASPGSTRIILWLILLYALGFAVMVVEDILSHTFI